MKNIYLLLILSIISCKPAKQTTKAPGVQQIVLTESYAAPRLFIYKTKKDYYNLVPISLSDDKKSIVSYPHPNDLVIDNKLAYPIKLPEGYYMDVKGIDKNVAFLKITYEDYSNLPKPPTIEQLKDLIEDVDPLIELWDCGMKMNEPEELSKIASWIISGKIAENCKQIK